mgnify:CR=1 FL=1
MQERISSQVPPLKFALTLISALWQLDMHTQHRVACLPKHTSWQPCQCNHVSVPVACTSAALPVCMHTCLPGAAELLRPLVDTLQQAAGVELKITVRNKGGEQQQVSTARRAQPGMTAQVTCRAAWRLLGWWQGQWLCAPAILHSVPSQLSVDLACRPSQAVTCDLLNLGNSQCWALACFLPPL